MSGSNNFFDRFKPNNNNNNNKNNGSSNSNPLVGWFQKVTSGNGTTTTSFSGQGQSLGGSLPGTVLAITLCDVGPLGIQIEKSTRGTAIVARVIPQSQAEQAGLQRGDILCFQDTNGSEEIIYEMFLELAASNQRPLCFDVRRVPSTKLSKNISNTNTSSTAAASSAAAVRGGTTTTSAEAFARKQAVIAAAEKRELAHKKLSKPVAKKDGVSKQLLPTTAERMKLEAEREQRIEDDKAKVLSQATLAALEQAKNAELATAQQLGYNPYESKSISAGQARSAVTTSTHGSMDSVGTSSSTTAPPTSGGGATNNHRLPTISAPRSLEAADENDTSVQQQQLEPSLEFQQAFETTVTSCPDHDAVVQSISIMRKLIVNATTKGQSNGGDNDEAAKFRKIRLNNPKIKVAITDMPGAVDLLLSVGFQLHIEGDDDDSILLYPPCYSGPVWLPTAIAQMEQYIQ